MVKIAKWLSLVACAGLVAACGGAPVVDTSSSVNSEAGVAASSQSAISISSIASSLASSSSSLANSSETTASSSVLASSSEVASSSAMSSSSEISSSSEAASSSSVTAIGFNPCPTNGNPCKILPLGDSITDGYGTPGGYRIPLFQKALNAGKNITFVGHQQNGPDTVDGAVFPKMHEGHSYWHVYQIVDLVEQGTIDNAPNIILLMIGTNDMNGDFTVSNTLSELVGLLVQTAPDALVVVAKIIPMESTTYGWALPSIAAYNNAIDGIVASYADNGKHVVMVDMHTGFLESELDDGIHPNPAGYTRMANVWYEAIKNYLP